MSLSPMRVTAKASAMGLLCSGQNGGCASSLYYNGLAAGASNTRPTTIPSQKLQMEDELDNWSDSVAKGKNGPNRGLKIENHFPQSTNEDSSMPSSPDSPTGCGNMADFSHSALELDTRELIGLFFRIYIGLSSSRSSRNKALSTLTRVVNDVIGKHQIAYNGMIEKLSLEQREDDMSFITVVAKNLFGDGTTNWGRVASLVAFGAMVSKRLKDNGREHCVEAVADQISHYLLTDQRDWLLSNKGWDGFVEFFHVEDPESVVRNALMAFAGVASIGAGLAFLIR
ncbi:hypothetical protein AGOR_G00043480 [Albula goreensis]|uniref:Bcl-2 Bcl-2 homology region 1-3 domain-containing protein n=1 Tax=Albula goreensis TaxID=1534307 RepID=A0A8T3DZ13_9TELE|nr:hypothetical protein AGOR_G00043480 [Albula goreensis]